MHRGSHPSHYATMKERDNSRAAVWDNAEAARRNADNSRGGSFRCESPMKANQIGSQRWAPYLWDRSSWISLAKTSILGGVDPGRKYVAIRGLAEMRHC